MLWHLPTECLISGAMMAAPWIPVLRSDDLPPSVAAPARAHGRDLAVWRSASGHLSAWLDRCPHRGMRLSHGFVRGEMLSCIYHGWSYDTGGRCRRIPAHPDLEPPAAIRATALPCAERDGLIWVGAEDAMPATIPGLDGLVTLRALDVAAGTAAVEAAFAAAGLRFRTGVVPEGTRLFLLVPPETDAAARIAASRAAEAARRVAEAATADAGERAA